jgi:ABC-type molybdenum transport system ATPase subunit/photorepair protein PhrA
VPFNWYTKQYKPSCLPGTRVGLLKKTNGWADGQDNFWLHGLAGKGKSTVARTVAHRYHNTQRLAASFFFSRDGEDDIAGFVSKAEQQTRSALNQICREVKSRLA